MKMIPIRAANASSVKRVKYLQEEDFFLTRQKKSKCFFTLPDDRREVECHDKEAEQTAPKADPQAEGHVVNLVRAGNQKGNFR